MPNWIGDFVMATPVLEDLRKLHPTAYIVVLCDLNLASLIENNPFIDDVILFSRKRKFFPKDSGGRSLITTIREKKFDIGILLTNSFSSAWIFLCAKVKKRVGFFKFFRFFLLTKNVKISKMATKQHLVDIYKKLLNANTNSKPSLFVDLREKLAWKTVIGISPSAAYGSAKCWIPERFRCVAERLINEIPNSEVIFFGGLSDVALIGEICAGLPDRVKNLSGKTTLRDLIAYIGSLDAFLTNDSGPMHIAAAVETPLVALFGSTDEEITGPYQFGHVIKKKHNCSPCFMRTCNIDFRCMNDIEVDEVVISLKRALISKIKLANHQYQKACEPLYQTSVVSVPSLIKKKVGVIILAAGAGRRLGGGVVKGCVEINGESLYEILLKKSIRAWRIAIMTSPITHEETVAHLKKIGAFNQVDLFQTRCLPRVCGSYSESPEGNGAMFGAFLASGLLDGKWSDIDLFSIVPIDNPLIEPFDEELVSLCDDLAVSAVDRSYDMGALVEIEGDLYVKEYFEVSAGENWKLGYIGAFVCSRDFFIRSASIDFPWHKVEKNKIIHYEKFIFDSFRYANRYHILLRERAVCFAPIKTKDDIVKVEKMLYPTEGELKGKL